MASSEDSSEKKNLSKESDSDSSGNHEASPKLSQSQPETSNHVSSADLSGSIITSLSWSDNTDGDSNDDPVIIELSQDPSELGDAPALEQSAAVLSSGEVKNNSGTLSAEPKEPPEPATGEEGPSESEEEQEVKPKPKGLFAGKDANTHELKADVKEDDDENGGKNGGSINDRVIGPENPPISEDTPLDPSEKVTSQQQATVDAGDIAVGSQGASAIQDPITIKRIYTGNPERRSFNSTALLKQGSEAYSKIYDIPIKVSDCGKVNAKTFVIPNVTLPDKTRKAMLQVNVKADRKLRAHLESNEDEHSIYINTRINANGQELERIQGKSYTLNNAGEVTFLQELVSCEAVEGCGEQKVDLFMDVYVSTVYVTDVLQDYVIINTIDE